MFHSIARKINWRIFHTFTPGESTFKQTFVYIPVEVLRVKIRVTALSGDVTLCKEKKIIKAVKRTQYVVKV